MPTYLYLTREGSFSLLGNLNPENRKYGSGKMGSKREEAPDISSNSKMAQVDGKPQNTLLRFTKMFASA